MFIARCGLLLTKNLEDREPVLDVSFSQKSQYDIGSDTDGYFLEKLALTEAAYATVRLMQEFPTLISRDPDPWHEGLSLTLAVGNGVNVSMVAA